MKKWIIMLVFIVFLIGGYAFAAPAGGRSRGGGQPVHQRMESPHRDVPLAAAERGRAEQPLHQQIENLHQHVRSYNEQAKAYSQEKRMQLEQLRNQVQALRSRMRESNDPAVKKRLQERLESFRKQMSDIMNDQARHQVEWARQGVIFAQQRLELTQQHLEQTKVQEAQNANKRPFVEEKEALDGKKL